MGRNHGCVVVYSFLFHPLHCIPLTGNCPRWHMSVMRPQRLRHIPVFTPLAVPLDIQGGGKSKSSSNARRDSTEGPTVLQPRKSFVAKLTKSFKRNSGIGEEVHVVEDRLERTASNRVIWSTNAPASLLSEPNTPRRRMTVCVRVCVRASCACMLIPPLRLDSCLVPLLRDSLEGNTHQNVEAPRLVPSHQS